MKEELQKEFDKYESEIMSINPAELGSSEQLKTTIDKLSEFIRENIENVIGASTSKGLYEYEIGECKNILTLPDQNDENQIGSVSYMRKRLLGHLKSLKFNLLTEESIRYKIR